MIIGDNTREYQLIYNYCIEYNIFNIIEYKAFEVPKNRWLQPD